MQSDDVVISNNYFTRYFRSMGGREGQREGKIVYNPCMFKLLFLNLIVYTSPSSQNINNGLFLTGGSKAVVASNTFDFLVNGVQIALNSQNVQVIPFFFFCVW